MLFPLLVRERSTAHSQKTGSGWQPSRDVNKSAIVPYLSGFQPRLFRCPQDQEPITLANGGTMPNGSTYAYGYSFTSYDLAGGSNRGIGKPYPFKLSSVNNPSGKIMLVDEDRKTLDDSRWVPRDAWGKVNAVAMGHDSKGVVVFADACGNGASPLRLRRTKFQSDFLGKNTMRMQRYEYSNARSINSDLEHVGTLFPCDMRRSKPDSGRWL